MRRLAPTFAVVLVMLACAAPAPAATGDLTFKDCIAKFASAPCTEVPSQVLQGGTDVVVSPNGNFVYVADGQGAIVGFTRSAADGSLAYQGCVDSESAGTCTHVAQFMLQQVRWLAFSPDGLSLYAVGQTADVVVRFNVGSNGALAFAGCAEDDGGLNMNCGKTVANLGEPEKVAVSPDGESVYVIDFSGKAVNHFAPDLTPRGCNSETAVGCSAGGPLDGARGLGISPDGNHVYVTSVGWDAVTWFNRAEDGSLTFAGCLADAKTAGTPTAGCTLNSSVNYDWLNAITFNPTGSNAYVVDETGLGVVYHLSRDVATGALAHSDCLSDFDPTVDALGCTELNTTEGSGLSGVTDSVVSPDAANLYAVASQDSALSTFELSSPAGTMDFIRCLRASAFQGCSAFANSFVFGSPRGVAITPDGRDLYVANNSDTPALLHFERDAPAARRGGGGPGSGPGTGPGTAPGTGPGTGPGSDPGTGSGTGQDPGSGTGQDPGSTPSPVRCNGLRATIVGTAGSNTIRGTQRRDVIAALGGNDVVKSLGGKDVVCGGNGRDTLDGGADRDVLLGEGGPDVLKGAGDVDRLLGGPGADRLIGGPGADRLLGGPGRDRLVGGPGRDTSKQ